MAIKCKNITKAYGNKKALQSISFQIKEGTITGLVGRNGAGKTTLLKIIAGYWHHTSGSLEVFGNEPFDHLVVSANTIFVDDQMAFPETLPLGKILMEASRFYRNWDMKFAQRLFDYFKFDANQFHHHLSKGKKSTFNMIVGLASRSPLTIFDEPTTGMDRAVRKDFYKALLTDYLAHPRTIIVSSHHLDEIEDILEDILLIDDGELIFHMSMDDLREYAIGITGNVEKLTNWSQGKEIFHEEKVGVDDLYIVTRNNIEFAEIEKQGFTYYNVSPSDLAIYVTNKSSGGIEHVFME